MTNRSAVAMIAPAGVLALLLAACDDVAPIEMTAPPPEAATEIEPTQAVDVAASSVDGQPALGGKLYDKWWAALGADAPEGDHPLWATQSTNPRSGADTWRCKECHGWDYKGAEGAYRSGSHFTGFPGVYDAAQSQTAEELMPALKGATNPDHDFSSVLDDEALGNLAVFLSQALIDMGEIVDYEAKAPKEGDPEHGRELFDGLCAVCHGQDGRNVNFGTPEEPEYVATVAMENPQEFLHKDRFGQPGSRPLMPATIELGWSLNDIVDVLAYAQTLPTESAPPDPRAAGGRLYDKWWAALGVDEPEDDHPLWATQSTNARSGADTWRCKECHGWDYRGADGAYGSGSHFTGFPGVYDAAQSKTAEELVAVLKGATNPDHDFSAALDDEALDNLATFLKEALIDAGEYIDYEAKAPKSADPDHGKDLFAGLCAVCHGPAGTNLNFGTEEEPEYVGTVAVENPQEFLHKDRFGQPGAIMRATIALGWSIQDVLDVLAYAQTLPTQTY